MNRNRLSYTPEEGPEGFNPLRPVSPVVAADLLAEYRRAFPRLSSVYFGGSISFSREEFVRQFGDVDPTSISLTFEATDPITGVGVRFSGIRPVVDEDGAVTLHIGGPA